MSLNILKVYKYSFLLKSNVTNLKIQFHILHYEKVVIYLKDKPFINTNPLDENS